MTSELVGPRLEMIPDCLHKFTEKVKQSVDLKLSEMYDPHDPQTYETEVCGSSQPGVYVFVTDRGEVRYVGMTTRKLGGELWRHFDTATRRESRNGAGKLEFPGAGDAVDPEPEIRIYTIPIEKDY